MTHAALKKITILRILSHFRRQFSRIVIGLKAVVALFAALIIVGCGEDIDPSTLNAEQLALYNPERPRSDRKRDESRKAEQVLKILEIKPGMKVVDLDAGNGYFTELFSSLVGPDGIVYMQNGNRYVNDFSGKIEDRLDDGRLPNVVRLDSSYNELGLPGDVDLIFSALSLHDIFNPQRKDSWNGDIDVYISQIKAALKDGGRLVIIDHSAQNGTGIDHTRGKHRIDEAYVQSLFENAGFTLVAKSDILRNPADDRTLGIFHKDIRRNTDQFFQVYEKKGGEGQ